MKITEDFVSFRVAKLLDGLGFNFGDETFEENPYFIRAYHLDEPDRLIYSTRGNVVRGYILAPSQALILKWLRVHYDVDITVMIRGASSYDTYIHRDRSLISSGTIDPHPDHPDAYYAAVEGSIEYVLHKLKSNEWTPKPAVSHYRG